MSLMSVINQQRVKQGGIIALGIAGILIATSVLAPASGAWFFDEKDMATTLSTGSLGLELTTQSGTNNNGVLNVAWGNILPGETRTEQFTVRNTGTIPGTLSIFSNRIDVSGIDRSALSSVQYTVDSYGALTPLDAAGTSNQLQLATLQGGESRTFTLVAALANTAGNEWQGAAVTNHMTVTLAQ